ncbi:MAG TPA: polysaccharide/polyol phosphate ABC transporter ATP-binding protein, partial [Clostridiales bacterium]|nr:polysaccharide/polyol phosphate ABC transporter ATP-binding protein [Clostridiales bacterium]
MDDEKMIEKSEKENVAPDALVEVSNVSMRFRMPAQKIDNLKEFCIKFVKRQLKYNTLEVLKNISFHVNRGESVGILGRNGAGKSTLLKLISGIFEPTEGTIKVRGSIVPLLKLGAGFDPEATGKENVFLNGA